MRTYFPTYLFPAAALAACVVSCGDGITNFDAIRYGSITGDQEIMVQSAADAVGRAGQSIKLALDTTNIVARTLGINQEPEDALSALLIAGGCTQVMSCGTTSCDQLIATPGTHAIEFTYKGDDCPINVAVKGSLVVDGTAPKGSYSATMTEASYSISGASFKDASELLSMSLTGDATAAAEQNVESSGTTTIVGSFETKSAGKVSMRVKSNLNVTKAGTVTRATGAAEINMIFSDFYFKAEVTATDVRAPTENIDPFVYKINNEIVTRAKFESFMGTRWAADVNDLWPFSTFDDGNGGRGSNLRNGLESAIDPF